MEPKKAQVLSFCSPDALHVYRCKVILMSGPISRAYMAANPEPPSRVIEILGSQSMEDLHKAIFKAFDRFDPHLYEFQVGGKKPMESNAVRYGPSELLEDGPKVCLAKSSSISSLQLKPGERFFYWFDFGDDWWHEISLLSREPIQKKEKAGKRYPRIVEKQGTSPPQYFEEDERFFDDLWEYEDFVLSPLQEERIEAIMKYVKEFCNARLNASYLPVCRDLAECCFEAGLPIEKSRPESWAAGIIHAAGMVNFLQDPASDPHMPLRDIATALGVSVATMENKSRSIRNTLDIYPLDLRFCLAENMGDNPFVSLLSLFALEKDLGDGALPRMQGLPSIQEILAKAKAKANEKEQKETKSKAKRGGKKKK